MNNSPLRTNKPCKFSLKGIPSPFGIERQGEQQHRQQQCQQFKLIKKQKYSTTNWEGIITGTRKSKNMSLNGKIDKHPQQKSLDKMFPLLTGEELKAFDSSVFEF